MEAEAGGRMIKAEKVMIKRRRLCGYVSRIEAESGCFIITAGEELWL